MQNIIDRIKKNRQKQSYLLDVLSLWAVAKEAGFDSHEIKAFTFRPEFLTREQKLEDRHKRFPKDRYNGSEWHNCVRLVTGELKEITLTRRPKEK